MPCKRSSVFDSSICSTSGRHLVCCHGGTGSPSMCWAVSENPLVPPPSPPSTLWHTYTTTATKLTASPQLSASQLSCCRTFLQNIWYASGITSTSCMKETEEWLLSDRLVLTFSSHPLMEIFFYSHNINSNVLSSEEDQVEEGVWWYWLDFRGLLDWQLPRSRGALIPSVHPPNILELLPDTPVVSHFPSLLLILSDWWRLSYRTY